MGFGVKDPASKLRRLKLQQHTLEILAHELQILQQHTLEFARAFLIRRNALHLLERPGHLAFVDRLPQRRRTAKIAVRQQVDLADAQPPAGHALNKSLEPVPRDRVHAPEAPQRVHVAVHRERPLEENPLDRVSHLRQQPAPHADPGLAPREHFGDFRHAQAMQRQKLDDEPRLLQDAQRLISGYAHQTHDRGGFIRAQ